MAFPRQPIDEIGHHRLAKNKKTYKKWYNKQPYEMYQDLRFLCGQKLKLYFLIIVFLVIAIGGAYCAYLNFTGQI